MIYLYALIEGDLPALAPDLADLPGLEGPLHLTRVGDWGLVHSPQTTPQVEPKRRLMLTHTRVQERMMPHGTVLPARFGLVAQDLEEVIPLITARAPVIRAEFAKVRDCVELGVRVAFDRQTALTATLAQEPDLKRERDRLSRLGREAHFAMAEFGGKLADRLDRRRGAAQGHLLRRLLPLLRDHVLRSPDEDTEVLRAEVLLPAAGQAEFETALAEAAKDLDFAPGAEPMISMIGPVPPYNFVRLSLALASEDRAA